MRRFYTPKENFSNSEVKLDTEETRHLRDVLRLHIGDEVRVFDGEGKEFLCRIEKINKKESNLKVIQEISSLSPESKLNLTLAVALLKGEKFELVIQKAVELGITKLVPIITKRTDVRLKDSDKKIERWRRIILESSKQCGRAKLLEISTAIEFTDFINDFDEGGVLFSERFGKGFSEIKSSKALSIIIGPEGGWDDSELELAKEKGIQIITLGGRILRAETAAIAIPALIQNHFGDLN